MMNYPPQSIQKREIGDIQKFKQKQKSKNNPSAIQLNQKMLLYKNFCYNWTELNTDNSKIGSWGLDLLGVQFKYIFPFFLGLSALIPSVEPSSTLRVGCIQPIFQAVWESQCRYTFTFCLPLPLKDLWDACVNMLSPHTRCTHIHTRIYIYICIHMHVYL